MGSRRNLHLYRGERIAQRQTHHPLHRSGSGSGSVAESITKVPGLKLKQLHTIRGDDLPLSRTDRTVTVNDSNGYDVSKNCVFINQEGDKLVMRMANKKNEWEII